MTVGLHARSPGDDPDRAQPLLEEMLSNVAEFYDEEIEQSLARIVSLVEPAILVIMGGVIAGLLLSVYLPLFNLLSQIGE